MKAEGWDKNGRMRPVAVSDIRITDELFMKYLDAVVDRVIPYQWEALNDRLPDTEKSHCIENFRIAAGELPGRHEGVVFQDTDLYKWLETVAFCIANGKGGKYSGLADEAIELIARAQESDGYINTYFTINCPDKKWTNLVEGHELYSGGHLIEAAVAYFDATGKRTLLNVACRFADLVCRTFGTEDGKCRGYPGHPEIELALVKLFRATGNRAYLDLANYFVRQRGQKPNYLMEEIKSRGGGNIFPEFAEYDAEYAQTHLPVTEQTEAVGHAVRAVYLYSAMADLAMECGDEALAASCGTLFDNITNRRMYITGGIGSSGKLERFTADYDLPNDRMYCESCASIGLMMFGQRMASLTGRASCYEAVERALCNTVLAGISIEGDRYFYVNPLEVWPDNCLPSTSMSHVKPVRQKWFSCACCPPNIARTLASLGQYVYARDESSLYVNMFVSSNIETELGSGRVKLDMKSSLIWDGTVRISAEYQGGGAFLRVRVPEYFGNPRLTVDGKEKAIETDKGYAVIELSGVSEIVFQGEVKARFVAANRHVRADIGQVAIMKGPFVYCIEEADNGDHLAAVSVSPEAELCPAEPVGGFPGGLPTIEFDGTRLTETIEEDSLYGHPHFVKEPVRLRAIPYAQWGNRNPGEMRVWLRADI